MTFAVHDLAWPLVAEITARTLRMAAAALAISLLIGLPLGIALGRARFLGRGAIVGFVNAGMGAPPSVIWKLPLVVRRSLTGLCSTP